MRTCLTGSIDYPVLIDSITTHFLFRRPFQIHSQILGNTGSRDIIKRWLKLLYFHDWKELLEQWSIIPKRLFESIKPNSIIYSWARKKFLRESLTHRSIHCAAFCMDLKIYLHYFIVSWLCIFPARSHPFFSLPWESVPLTSVTLQTEHFVTVSLFFTLLLRCLSTF